MYMNVHVNVHVQCICTCTYSDCFLYRAVCTKCISVHVQCTCIHAGGKITLESMKVQEYITECFQHADADPNEGV